MAGFKNYETDAAKHSSKINLFKINRNRKKSGVSHSENFNRKMHIWVAYYRQNPHRFAKEFLNVDLKVFQSILLWAMMHNDIFMFIASRGLGSTKRF